MKHQGAGELVCQSTGGSTNKRALARDGEEREVVGGKEIFSVTDQARDCLYERLLPTALVMVDFAIANTLNFILAMDKYHH